MVQGAKGKRVDSPHNSGEMVNKYKYFIYERVRQYC